MLRLKAVAEKREEPDQYSWASHCVRRSLSLAHRACTRRNSFFLPKEESRTVGRMSHAYLVEHHPSSMPCLSFSYPICPSVSFVVAVVVKEVMSIVVTSSSVVAISATIPPSGFLRDFFGEQLEQPRRSTQPGRVRLPHF